MVTRAEKSKSVASLVKNVKLVYGFGDFLSLLEECCSSVQHVLGLLINLKKEKKNSHKIVIAVLR